MDVAAAVGRYLSAARRGVAWLEGHQHDDGSLGPPVVPADVYHKAGYALGITGRVDRASRLIDWIRGHDLRDDGGLFHFDQGLALYKTCWACQSAHRLARFDLARPVMDFIATQRAPSGGFYHNETERGFVEAVCTSWAGVTAIYHGRDELAAGVAGLLHEMIAAQPMPGRWYYRTTPHGHLITTGELAVLVDGEQVRQAYYCPGIALLFLARWYLATAADAVLADAQTLFEQTLAFGADGYEYVTAAKGGVATAILYRLTGDPRFLAAATQLGDYLTREQSAEGWWANPYDQGIIVRLDHTAEFVVFLSEIAANLAGA